jgi:hypothetical protein
MDVKEKIEMERLAVMLMSVSRQLSAALRVLEAAEAAEKLLDQVRKLTLGADTGGSEQDFDQARHRRAAGEAFDARGVALGGRERMTDPPLRSAAAEAAKLRAGTMPAVGKPRPPTGPNLGTRGAAVFDACSITGATKGRINGGSAGVPF